MKKDNSLGILKMFGILIVIILIAFAFGYFIKQLSSPKVYKETSNGFVFQRTQGSKFWYTTIYNPLARQEINVDFRYPPSQVKNVTVVGNPNSFFDLLKQGNLTAAYITFNLTGNLSYANSLVGADLSKFLKVINGITLVAGCIKNNTDVCSTRPVITCQNQDDRAVVIYVKNSNISRISMTKNCLTIEGMDEGMVRAYTRLLFSWYGII